MKTLVRATTLVLFAAIAVIASLADLGHMHRGTPSATLVFDNLASMRRFVVKNAPGRDPLKARDVVEISSPRDLAALQFNAFKIGASLYVKRIVPGPQTTLADPIVAVQSQAFALVIFMIQAMFIGIAALIAARGRTGGSLSLAWLFALIVLLFNPTTPDWPDWLLIAYAILNGTLAVIASLCATDFATKFAGDPDAVWARRYRIFARVWGAFAIAISIYASSRALFSPTLPAVIQYAASTALMGAAAIFLFGLGLAYLSAADSERQRVSWVAVSLSIGIVGLIAAVWIESAGYQNSVRNLPLLLIAMPLGRAYSILRYRLLDISFIINRATVFGVTSLLVLAALALLDFGLQTLLGTWLLKTGLYVQLGLALSIGIATRPLHERVDRLVDDLFFRRRHEAERALRHFEREVAFIDDPLVVQARTVAVVAAAADTECVFALRTLAGFVQVATSSLKAASDSIDRNDPLIVRLLATRTFVDFHDVGTALSGDYAFPMFARNQLIGLLLCGGKVDGARAYAPDELEAIGAVAHASGLALDSLRIETLERELERTRGLMLRTATTEI